MTEPPLVARGATSGLVGGALAVAVVTIVARVVGLGRWVVFSKTVGGGCLADAYNTANLLPNVLFEIVAEGALAVGTTLGVAALALTVALPVRAAGVRVRPGLAFPDGVLPRVRALAAAGIAVLLAQQGTLLVIAWLANHSGEPGAMTSYTW